MSEPMGIRVSSTIRALEPGAVQSVAWEGCDGRLLWHASLALTAGFPIAAEILIPTFQQP